MSVFVDTRCGRLRGEQLRSFEGYDYCAFKGIPFAKPPVGQLRFRDPVPAEPWSGVRDATSYGPPCCQNDFITRSIQGSDDCLYLNVYMRNTNSKNRLPVMVWIHGGAFMFGSADDFLYGPDYLLRKDIVLVTCNYRLGVLGFLNFNDEAAPGNQGLKDQVMVLRWVQENIVNFGGDKDNVTIFGESAGGASVHYLALSKMTKGLFHKAISQSGVSCNTWACTENTSNAYKICDILGNKSTDPKELVEFLRTIDCEKLIEAQEKLRSRDDKLTGTFPFGPGIDNKSLKPLMPMHPLEASEEGVQVPYILGCNTREGIFILPGLKSEDFDNLDRNFENYLSPITVKMLQRNRVTPDELKRFYFGDEKICEKNIDKFVDLWSDIYFIEGIHKVLAAQVKQSSASTYFYRFTFDKQFSITKSFSNTSMPGSSHFDDVQYQFSMNLYDVLNIERLKRGSKGYRIMEQIVEMWTNFAKYGRPTPFTSDLLPTYWLPVTDEKVFRTLNINEALRMEGTLSIDERLSFGKHTKNKL